ncbi:MAG: methylmalonyl-CoA mutase small subunit, partial [Bacteroidales bacterium]|nr:methylmalonyl-CoA mutase small subunit [Bacteroidales bacterium]
GTNQYPNSTEFISEDFETLANKAFKIQDQDTDTETLKPYRGAMAFEKLRFQTDKYSKNADRPKVFLITMGNLAMRRARAQFAGNFFGCAGYEIIDNNGFNSAEEAAKACVNSNADIAVICSSDDEYADIAPKLYDLLYKKTIVVVAGYPRAIIDDLKQIGIKHFIHIKSNVLETLEIFQKSLKINNM